VHAHKTHRSEHFLHLHSVTHFRQTDASALSECADLGYVCSLTQEVCSLCTSAQLAARPLAAWADVLRVAVFAVRCA